MDFNYGLNVFSIIISVIQIILMVILIKKGEEYGY